MNIVYIQLDRGLIGSQMWRESRCFGRRGTLSHTWEVNYILAKHAFDYSFPLIPLLISASLIATFS